MGCINLKCDRCGRWVLRPASADIVSCNEDAHSGCDGALILVDDRQNDRPKVAHYQQGTIEPIEFLFAHGLGEHFCAANVIYYLIRYPHKVDPIGDLKKARDYIGMLIKHLEGKVKNE